MRTEAGAQQPAYFSAGIAPRWHLPGSHWPDARSSLPFLPCCDAARPGRWHGKNSIGTAALAFPKEDNSGACVDVLTIVTQERATGMSPRNPLQGSLGVNPRILAPFRPNPSVLCDIAQGIDVVDRPLWTYLVQTRQSLARNSPSLDTFRTPRFFHDTYHRNR